MKNYFLLLLLALFVNHDNVFAGDYWTKTDPSSLKEMYHDVQAKKAAYHTLHTEFFQRFLKEAPDYEYDRNQYSNIVVELPLPYGGFQSFRIFNSPVMEEGLAEKFPEINTYIAISNDGFSYGRVDFTLQGFHAMIFTEDGTFYIDPVSRQSAQHYISYYRKDFQSDKIVHPCLVHDDEDGRDHNPEAFVYDEMLDFTSQGRPKIEIGSELRTYRLAVAATGEYTIFHGGTVASALSAIVTTVNRVNGVYERDLSVRLILIANNDLIIYTNPNTDPYTNGNPSLMIGENQTNITNVIGAANYDIGHVFGTNSGGLAGLGVVCNNTSKARGVTGSASPVGDPFDIDYVAHEIGHQFGASHSFNSTAGGCSGNRSSNNAFEPGSGSTIMAYAGLCNPENLQNQSHDYFHAISFINMFNYIVNGNGNNCPVRTNTGNSIPEITMITPSSTYTIPISTPFEMRAMATDADGDVLTYCWEQYDRQNTATPINSPSGNQPIFRSFPPTTNPNRVFPRWSDILNNTQTMGELLPNYSRDMSFRLYVRDNKPGAGGVFVTNFNDNDPPSVVRVTVTANAGPFVVTNPNTAAVSWSPGSVVTVSWNVAGTTGNGVNCSAVDILLSVDGGENFNIVLAESVPNNGSASITVPSQNTNQARVMVRCANNIFFDVSDANFSIIFDCNSVNSTITIHSVSNDTLICVGDNLQLSVDASTPDLDLTYQWLRNGVEIPGATNAVYNITNAQMANSGVYACRVSTICSQATTSGISVQVSTRPPAPQLFNNNGQLVSDYTATNIWYLNGQVIPGVSSFTFTPELPGVYTVSAVMNGCPSAPSNAIEISDVNSIDAINPENNVLIFPNPSNGVFTVVVENHSGKFELELLDILGKSVYRTEFSGNSHIINAADFSKGTYFVRIQSQQGNVVKKILIN
jgi:hypothetical protein